jgi:hypothetical protein
LLFAIGYTTTSKGKLHEQNAKIACENMSLHSIA